ncbi:MAG: hypothetical protein ACP5QP_03465 [Brevinematia bacterium]
MSYTPLDVKTVIFSDNLLLKNTVNNPAYASALQSQAKIQLKEKSDIEQNRPQDLVEISREEEKIRRKKLGEDGINYQQQENKKRDKEEEYKEIVHVYESGKGENIDIIV